MSCPYHRGANVSPGLFACFPAGKRNCISRSREDYGSLEIAAEKQKCSLCRWCITNQLPNRSWGKECGLRGYNVLVLTVRAEHSHRTSQPQQ